MRSDRDKRTDTEKEIEDFLSQFETPVEDLTTDFSSYLEEEEAIKHSSAEQTFLWMDVTATKPKEKSVIIDDEKAEVMLGDAPETAADSEPEAENEPVKQKEHKEHKGLFARDEDVYGSEDSVIYHRSGRSARRHKFSLFGRHSDPENVSDSEEDIVNRYIDEAEGADSVIDAGNKVAAASDSDAGSAYGFDADDTGSVFGAAAPADVFDTLLSDNAPASDYDAGSDFDSLFYDSTDGSGLADGEYASDSDAGLVIEKDDISSDYGDDFESLFNDSAAAFGSDAGHVIEDDDISYNYDANGSDPDSRFDDGGFAFGSDAVPINEADDISYNYDDYSAASAAFDSDDSSYSDDYKAAAASDYDAGSSSGFDTDKAGSLIEADDDADFDFLNSFESIDELYESEQEFEDPDALSSYPEKGLSGDISAEPGVEDEYLSGEEGDARAKAFRKRYNKTHRRGFKISRMSVSGGVAALRRKVAIPPKKTLKQRLFLKRNPNYDPSLGAAYEKDGKTIKNKEYIFSWRKLIRDIACVMLLCVLAGVGVVGYMIFSAPQYDYRDIYSAVDTSSIVYDDKGKQVDTVFYTENRKIIPYSDMPEDLINAFVAIEDKTFWKHHGFNWTRMIGAVLSSITGNGRISGTSTITQQLARNVYLADIKSVRSIKRKILEMYYAARIEHALSKEEIIEAYLNTIYLGHGCYGVNAAAKTYFNSKVKKLNLIESASLAALPQSPDTYALLKLASEAQNVVDSKVVANEPDTVVTNDIAKNRRQLTLDLMLDQGYITKEQHDEVYDKALNDFIHPNLKSSASNYSYFHEYLVDTIIEDLQKQYELSYEDAERMVYTKGLQIYSTMDKQAQDIIAKEFQDGSNFPYVTAPRDYEGNMLNNDGQIALYNYHNDFDEDGDFTLYGEDGDVKIHKDGSVTIKKNHKLHIYETEVGENIDYSLEFKNYYIYDENDILYSIAGGYVNIPMEYKTADEDGNVVISADYFSDPLYEGAVKKKGKNLILTEKSYTLSPRSRQPQAAMTIVGVGTGEVKAMVGGRQFGGQKVLNRSLNSRQPGSSIKPLAVYGAALQKSYDLAEEGKKWKFTDYGIDKQGTKGWGDYVTVHSSIEDERTRIEGKNWPNNFNNSFSGKNTFKTAIQKSINTCAVKLEFQIGADYSINQLKKFGLTTVQDDTSNPVNDANPAALALGAMTHGVQPLEMALAYAAFPAGGKLNSPICYTKVLDRDGNVLLEGKSEQTEALNEGVAWIMTDVLQSVVNFNRYMYVEGVEPGGKTGTTNDQYDIWFDGFTPSYAASIWIGTDENIEMSSMSTPAAALWGRIINQIPKAKKGEYASKPGNVISKYGEYFTSGTETGLTSWSDAEARKKAREKALKKWQAERQKHRHKVIDVKGHYENKLVTPEKYEDVIVQDAWDEEIKDEEGNVIDVKHHDAVKEKRKVADAVYKQIWIEEKWHWEYDKGWRDGDFSYSDD